jgi:hypothetical protein
LTLYTLSPVRRIPAGEGFYIFQSRLDEKRHLLSTFSAELLLICKNFNTIEEHASAALSSPSVRRHLLSAKESPNPGFFRRLQSLISGSDHLKIIKEELISFVAKGLLVSKEELLTRRAGNSQIPVTTLGTVTRNRPQALHRCLDSFLKNAAEAKRDIKVVVVDGSDDQIACEVKERLSSLSLDYRLPVLYAGKPEKQRFIDRAVQKGFCSKTLNFALFGGSEFKSSTGSNRNGLLLYTAGEAIVSVDDDTVCDIRVPKGSGKLKLTSNLDPYETRFFSSREEAIEFYPKQSTDYFALHEKYLGQELARVLGTFSLEEIEIENCSSDLLSTAYEGEGKLLITVNGLAGDSALGGPARYLWLTGESRENFVASKEQYRRNSTSREVVRSVSSTTVTNSPLLLTTFVGMDNRCLLPPFMPLFRGQDGLFSLLTRKCYKSSLTCYLPFNLLHSPVDPRTNSRDEIWNRTGFQFNTMLQCIVEPLELRSSDPCERLVELARALIDVGRMQHKDFREYIREQYWSYALSHIDSLERLLNIYNGKPDYWAKDVKLHINELRKSLLDDSSYIPRELSTHSDPLQAARELIGLFGKLLLLWPDLMSFTKENKLDLAGASLGP